MTPTEPQPSAAPTAGAAAEAGAPAVAEQTSRPPSSAAALVLACLAVGFVLWAAQGLIVPILLAMFFALLGNPIIRMLRRVYVPRFIGAVAVLSAALASAVLMGNLLAGPAADVFSELPRQVRQIAPKLRKVVEPVQQAREGAERIARAAGGDNGGGRVVKAQMDDPYATLIATPKVVAAVLTVVLLSFFFMVYGENLQRKILALVPGRQGKKLTIDILQSIEREISRYVLTISLINTALGIAVAGTLLALGLPLPEAALWGAVAALLNFAPYVGPLIGVFLMMMMGFMQFDDALLALAPVGAYLLLHTLESQLLTPIVLGRRLAISPLALILGLVVFGWLWGIAGLLLAVPLLASLKLVLERVEGLERWAGLLE